MKLTPANVHLAYQDVLYKAWNTYTSECNQAAARWPAKPSPCGRFMEFSPEYEEAIEKAKIKREKALSDFDKLRPPLDPPQG